MKQQFRLDTQPVAHPANVLQGDRYRITVLDAGLVRLEYDESGTFEDRASQTAVHRAFPATDFTVTEKDGLLEVHTERLHLIYDKGTFTTQGLSVQAKGGYHSRDSVWRPGSNSASRPMGSLPTRYGRPPGACTRAAGRIRRSAAR